MDQSTKKAAIIFSALSAAYIVISGGATGVIHTTTNGLTSEIDARSAAAINEKYEKLAGTQNTSPLEIRKSHQGDLAFMKEVNHEICSGPEDWAWTCGLTGTNMKPFEPTGIVNQFRIATKFTPNLEMPSLTLTQYNTSTLSLNRLDDADEAARDGIKLIEFAAENVAAAEDYAETTAFGLYTLGEDGTVTFVHETQLNKNESSNPEPSL